MASRRQCKSAMTNALIKAMENAFDLSDGTITVHQSYHQYENTIEFHVMLHKDHASRSWPEPKGK